MGLIHQATVSLLKFRGRETPGCTIIKSEWVFW